MIKENEIDMMKCFNMLVDNNKLKFVTSNISEKILEGFFDQLARMKISIIYHSISKHWIEIL